MSSRQHTNDLIFAIVVCLCFLAPVKSQISFSGRQEVSGYGHLKFYTAIHERTVHWLYRNLRTSSSSDVNV